MDIDEFYAHIEYVVSRDAEAKRLAQEQKHHEEMGDVPMYSSCGDLVWVDEAEDEQGLSSRS